MKKMVWTGYFVYIYIYLYPYLFLPPPSFFLSFSLIIQIVPCAELVSQISFQCIKAFLKRKKTHKMIDIIQNSVTFGRESCKNPMHGAHKFLTTKTIPYSNYLTNRIVIGWSNVRVCYDVYFCMLARLRVCVIVCVYFVCLFALDFVILS